MKTVTVCSSASFYKQVVDMQSKVEKLGYNVIIPAGARAMKKSGDFDVTHTKTWYNNPDDYHKKAALMRGHFDEIAKGDAVLVLNYEKHGVANYIGGNVLMEMALAFYLKKPIFILNDIPQDSPFEEEIKGFEPVVLRGKLEDLKF